MGRYTQGLRLRALTAELAIAKARGRWFALGGAVGAGLVALVALLI